MKQLQNNFTTIEQSKQLLELGVPADSADCYLKEYYIRPIILNKITFSDFVSATTKCIMNKPEDYLPCWSVGRLMEIIRICNLTVEKPWVYIEQDNIHAMITAITDGVNNHMLDFSKLEE